LILRREKDIMPRKCVVAGCNTKEGMGHSFHGFPMKNPAVCAKWVRAVHQNRKDWEGLTSASLLCSKHFEPECFDTDGARHREKVGLKAKKASLKRGAIPTIFSKTNAESSSSCQTGRPASEWRMRKAVCKIFFSKKL